MTAHEHAAHGRLRRPTLTMRAIVQDRYGSADVLRLDRIARPDDPAPTRCSCACTRPVSTAAPGT